MWVCDQALHIYQFPRVSLSPGEVVLSLHSDRCRAIWRLFIMMAPPLDEASHRSASRRRLCLRGRKYALLSPHAARRRINVPLPVQRPCSNIDEREDPASMKSSGFASTNLPGECCYEGRKMGSDGKDIFPYISRTPLNVVPQ